MKILIVEDNRHMAESLRLLVNTYYVTEIAYTGEQAMTQIEEHDFGLVILDLNLPDASGLDICRAIREEGKNMPILIVTGEDRQALVVELLDAGADDYITKPFKTREIKARIRALLRRQETRNPAATELVVGDLTLNLTNHYATRQGQRIPLRSKEFIILEELMLHPNIAMSRSLLLSKAWDSADNAWTNTIDVHIKALRDKIDKPFGKKSIETVHGLGYRLVAPTAKRR